MNYLHCIHRISVWLSAMRHASNLDLTDACGKNEFRLFVCWVARQNAAWYTFIRYSEVYNIAKMESQNSLVRILFPHDLHVDSFSIFRFHCYEWSQLLTLTIDSETEIKTRWLGNIFLWDLSDLQSQLVLESRVHSSIISLQRKQICINTKLNLINHQLPIKGIRIRSIGADFNYLIKIHTPHSLGTILYISTDWLNRYIEVKCSQLYLYTACNFFTYFSTFFHYPFHTPIILQLHIQN